MRLALTLVSALLLSLGCSKPKPGDRCEDPGRRTCVDAKSALYCAVGTWQLDTCKKGCTEEKGSATCDLTENLEGDPCPAALDGFGACRSDRQSRAICQKGKYVVEPCRGPDGCTMQQAGMSTCDHAVTKIGDRCTVDAKIELCAPEGFVRCKDGVITLAQKCPGPAGCKDQGGGRVSCDPNGAFAEGDLCHFIASTCSADGKALLACKDGKLAKERSCPGPDGCNPSNPAALGAPTCDTGLAKVGDPCTAGRACSEDGTALLSCKPAKSGDSESLAWVVDRKCKSACTPKDHELVCD